MEWAEAEQPEHAPRKPRAPRLASAPQRRESASAVIRRALRAEIIDMTRKPGDPISEKGIAGAYGVSRTPVREALLALAEEGLIDIFPQSGTFVARIPLDGMPEAMLIRESLEQTIVRIAASRCTGDDAARLDQHLASQRVAAEADDARGFHLLDEDFHATLASIAGFPGVWSLVQQVKYQIDRFRHMTLGMAGRSVSIVDEHAAIVAGIAANDAEAAVAAMTRHLSTVRTGLDAALALNSDYFTGGDIARPLP